MVAITKVEEVISSMQTIVEAIRTTAITAYQTQLSTKYACGKTMHNLTA